MGPDTLVEKWIDDGRKLVDYLAQNQFAVTGAIWLRASMNGKWYFYIVSPVMDTEGFTAAHRKLHPLVRAVPQLSRIDPLAIKLIGPSHPIARDILNGTGPATTPQGVPVRWRGIWLGGMSVEEVYVYLVPATTP